MMQVYMVMFNGNGWEVVDYHVFLQYEDAKKHLEKIQQEHIEECKKRGWDDYSHRYDIVDFELLGNWIDV